MEKFPVFVLSLLVFLLYTTSPGMVGATAASGRRHGGGHKLRRLFVFGDSYTDTGNIRKSISDSWKPPYGVTFPGKPSGRFSDGRVLTDYVAKFLGLKSPFPYTWRKYAPARTKHGVNFAFGGTGVFDTLAPLPNMTSQIDFFLHMLHGNDAVRIPPDLSDSVALLSCVGNDYNAFFALGGSFQDLPKYIAKVVNQLALNLQRIQRLGMKKMVVTTLQPLGCLPQKTVANSFRQCNATDNSAVVLHNSLLRRAVDKLNADNGGSRSPIVVLDLFNSFMLALRQKETTPGSARFEEPLKPCCMGVNATSSCSSVDANGHKLYTVCDDPKTTFFWDAVHPTQAGWDAVYGALQPSLRRMYD